MKPIAYLTHRLPYPPDKGDKLRSYHLLRHLAARHRVFLGSFIDDAADVKHLPALNDLCAGMHVARLRPRLARVLSARALITGEPMTLAYFRDAGLDAWLARTVAREGIDTVVVFCSAMAQYVRERFDLHCVIDFVDVDSAKWAQYASSTRGWRGAALGWLYRREARRLLAFETEAALHSRAAVFVTDAEARLFAQLAPAAASRVHAIGNGVDAQFFNPQHGFPSPYRAAEHAVVFTGVMDYWPNEEAVTWFVREVLPRVCASDARVRFYIVGMRPSRAVRALASHRVVVTGRVEDVRPYLAHAAAVVAPLRIARGIQNKVLEAMSMARAVVTTRECAAAIEACPNVELAVENDATRFADRLLELLHSPEQNDRMGAAARRCVVERYGWNKQLAGWGQWV